MTIQSSDRFQVQSGSTQYSDSASNLKAGTKSYDHLLVRRGSTNYKLPKNRRYDVEYSDNLLVNRSNTNYKETGQNYLNHMWSYGLSSKKGTSYGGTGSAYGTRVSVSDGYVAIAGRQGASFFGSVGVYTLGGAAQYNKTGPSSFSQFGYACDTGNGKLVVGAYGVGAAYIYNLASGNLEKTIQPSVSNFGVWVAVGDGIIAIIEDSSTNSGSSNGSCYVYDLSGNFITRIFTPDPYGSSRLGSCNIGNGKLIIGMRTFGGSADNNGGLHIYNASTRAYETSIYGSVGDQLGYVGSSDWCQTTLSSNLLVAGTANEVVRVYNLSGSLQYNISKPGSGDPFGWGRAAIVGAGRIFVLDPRNNDFGTTKRLYSYDLSGNAINNLTITGNDNSSGALGLDTGLGCCVTTDVATGTDNGGFYTIGNTVV